MPFIQNYSPEAYGAGPQNWAVVQDHRGLVYVANTSGVLEFDGSRWRVIRIRNKTFARSLDVSEDGTVYVGGLGEFGYLASDLRGNTVYKSLVDRIEEQYRQFMDVWSIHATPHGVYFVTIDKIFRWVEQRMEVIFCKKENIGFRVGPDVYVLHKQGGISKLHAGRLHLLPETQMFTRKSMGRVAIGEFDRDTLLLLTEKGGAFLYHLKGFDRAGASKKTRVEPFPTEMDAYLRRNMLYYGIDKNQKGEIFIPTLLGGVVVMDRSGRLVQIINQKRGIISDEVSSVLVDREQNAWAATSLGMSYLEVNSPWSRFAPGNERSTIILGIARYGGRLFLGTLQGVYQLPEYHLRLEDDSHEFVLVGTNKNQCWAMYPTRDRLFVGLDNEVWGIDGDRAKRLLRITENRWVYSFGSSGKFPDYVFLGLYAGGLRAMKLRTGDEGKTGTNTGAELAAWSPGEVAGESIISILGDRNGDLWLGSQLHGIVRIQFTGDSLDEYKATRYGPEQGLLLLEITQMAWVDGRLVVNNAQGSYRAEEDAAGTIRFVQETRFGKNQNQESGVRVVGKYRHGYIVEDDQGVGFWRQTTENKTWLDRTAFKPVPTDVLAKRWRIEEDGVVWMSSNEILYRYDPRLKKNVHMQFPALIRKVRTGRHGSLFEGNFFESDATNHPDSLHTIVPAQSEMMVPRFDYEDNAVGFGFSAAFYEQPHKTRFRYQLEGFDRVWSQWEDIRYKEYTNLPEGSYVFRVQALNLYGQKSTEAAYRFVIRPPWYRTTLAFVGYVIGFALIMAGSVRIYTWRLVQAKRKLEKLVETRTKALQESLQQLKQVQDQLIQASHRAGMAEVATSVLHNIGNVLNSVNVSSNFIYDRLKRSRMTNIGKIVDLLDQHVDDLVGFFTLDPKGKVLPTYLRKIDQHLVVEREVVLEEIARLQTSIDHMKNIVSAQQKTASASRVKEHVEIPVLVGTALDMSEFTRFSRDIELEKDLDDLPLVVLEKHKTLQILVNLIQNAIQSLMECRVENKTLTIRVRKTGEMSNYIRVAVIDNGIGIHKENISKIFGYGFTTKADGNGFGLHMSANAATEMGGALTCDSEGPGKGASFYLDLPYQAVSDGSQSA